MNFVPSMIRSPVLFVFSVISKESLIFFCTLFCFFNGVFSSSGCYRIMEAAIEQACSLALLPTAASPQSSTSSLSLQQSRQVLGVLEEAFSAVMYFLEQVRRI